MRKTVISALILAALPAASLAMDDHAAMRPDALKWSAAPPGLPPGSEIAVLAGDPTKDGPFVIRLKTPANYRVPAHTHPDGESVTVISGTFNIGAGGKLDTTKGEAMPAGSFKHVPKDLQHYAWSTGPTIIQIHGMGPFGINYVNPDDDPRNTATTGSTGSK